MGRTETPIEWIVDKRGCWNCTSHKPDHGRWHPRAVYQGKMEYISRIMYRKHKGDIPAGMVIRHTCDNPLCINPDHLLLGTNRDNSRDRKERNRTFKMTGTKHYATKLSEEDAKRIYALPHDKRTREKLANQYGISVHTVIAIQTGQNWKEVTQSEQSRL